MDKRSSKISLFIGITLCIIGGLFTYLSLNLYVPNIVPLKLRVLSLNKKTSILFLGIDEVFPGRNDVNENSDIRWKGRSDTIIILVCDPFKNTINALNIPRDTRIAIDGYDIEKINYLNAKDGPEKTKRYVEALLGTDIDHFVAANLQGIRKIIDEIGGIVVDVPQRMKYEDHTAMLKINLYPGKQLLNGKQAVGFLRFRHDSLGDIGRITRQQKFMKALLKKMLDPTVLAKTPAILSNFKDDIYTDLTNREIIQVANFLRNVPSSKQRVEMLPGKSGELNGASYWIPLKKETRDLVNDFFYK